MTVINGRVIADPPDAGSFAGHRVLVTWSAPSSSDGDVAVPGAASAPIAADDKFSVDVPDGVGVEAAILAPSGVVLSRTNLKADQLTTAVTLTARPASGYVVRPSDDPRLGTIPRLTGRVIDRRGGVVPGGVAVVLWGVDNDGVATPLVAVDTQSGGYFGAPWPDRELASAFGSVAGGEHLPIPLESGRLPTRVILVVDELPEDASCDCHAVPPRAPDQADLVANPSAFSQDLGGRCVNLTMPNRVLEEYHHTLVVRSTEPDVRPITIGQPPRVPPKVLTALQEVVTKTALQAASDNRAPAMRTSSAPLETGSPDGDAFLQKLDAAAVGQLLSSPESLSIDALYAAGLASATRETLRLLDIVRGVQPVRTDLDGTHAIDWDDTPTVYEAVTVAIGHVLHFRQVWRADGYSLGDLVHSIPLAPGEKRQIAVLDWERQTTAARSEQLEYEETLSAIAERDRDINEIAGSHLEEHTDAGSDSSTWAAGGGIGAGFIGSGFGIFGGVAGGASGADSSSWQDSARSLTANSLQQLSDRTSQRASALRDERSTVVQTVAQDEQVSAQTEVIANYNHCHAVTVQYFEVLRHFLVTHELASVSECLFVPLPMLPFDAAKARRWRATLSYYLRDQSLLGGFDAVDRIASNWVGADFPEHRYSQEPPEVIEGELRVRFVIPRPPDDKDGAFTATQWNWLIPYLSTAPLMLFNLQLAALVAAQRDLYFRDHVAPGIAEQLMHHLKVAYVTRAGVQIPVPMEATLVSRYDENIALYVSLRPAGALAPLPREEIARLRIWFDGLALPPDARIMVESGRARYDTAHLRHVLFDAPRINADLARATEIVIPTPLDPEERRDPRAEDRRLADRLLRHLNENLEFYHQAIWHGMDAARRYLLLDGMIAPQAGGRSVASVVENTLIGIVGNCLVMPVTPGIHLDPTLVPDPETGELVDLVHAFAPDPPDPVRISVPTRGVYAEAVMGACDSCETIDDTRFWRWEESPDPDNPTVIAPLSLDSRVASEPDLTPTPLPPSIVNIQAPAALPDPLGLQQALEVLGRSDIFRDPTGLAGTQRNALSAFKGVMDVAKSLGGTAAKLAQQQEIGRNVDRTLDQITSARAAGLLTDQQANELAHTALQGLVGQPPVTQTSPVHDPAVSKAIDAATQSQQGTVSVATPDETVQASFDGTGADDVALGAVPTPQFTNSLDSWVSGSLVQDGPTFAGPPPHKFVVKSPITTVAALRNTAPMGAIVDAGQGNYVWLDNWDALVSLGRLRIDPAVATRFQLYLRLRLCYPADARHLDRLIGTGAPNPPKLPVVVIAHGVFDSWNPLPVLTAGTAHTVQTPAGPQQIPSANTAAIDEKSSYLGYEYLQAELARHGIVSVSVDGNFANFFGCGVQTRADLIQAAIDQLVAAHNASTGLLSGRLDLGKFGLIGHSRGGDGVVQAAKQIRGSGVPPVLVLAVSGLAPSDLKGGDVPAVRPTLTANEAGFYYLLYGALDNDIYGGDGASGPVGTGFRQYDRADCQKASTYLERFSHNGFNTVWLADGNDTNDPRCRGGNEHQKMAVEYIGDLMRWKLKGEPLGGRFDGRTANSLGERASLQWSFGTTLKVVDDFQNPSFTSLGAPRTMPASARVEEMGDAQISAGPPPVTMDEHTPHQTKVVHVDRSGATAPGTRFLSSDIPATHKDWASFDLLLVSLSGWYDPTSDATVAAAPLPRVKITLTDTANKSAIVDWNTYGKTRPNRPIRKNAHGNDVCLMPLETVPVPIKAFTGIDRRAIKSISFDTDPADSTHLFLDSIALVKR